ncbi:DNA helicase rad5 [Phytophthora pseudosyringae]|uniref:DNA helicase rad5 n=1 Tax=Phytophthora pseudosyringae TaxID=221518 RepID=A0A8T1V7L0_9STRA|nr:DNA helicase rad5 [Phytophthora pseudosyringae]
MLTRSRSKAANQPVFIDDKWNDAYIQTKDEQIDALMAADASQRGWDELEEENSDDAAADDDSDSDAWLSDSDASEDNAEDWLERPRPELSFVQRWVAGGGLLQNAGWTLAAVGVAPMLLYVSLPRASDRLWPLQSLRLAGTLAKLLLNLLTLAAAGGALYGASCSVRPLTLSEVTSWRRLELQPPAQCGQRLLQGGRDFVGAAMEALSIGSNPSAPLRRLDDDLWTLVASLDTPVVRELALLAAGALVTLTCFHRAWAKTLVLATAASYAALNVLTEVKLQQRAAVEIFSLDPTFAFVNESIFVAIDGQNLEQGGSVAWAPYWGGVQQQQAQACPKRFPQQLSNGGVLVTFAQVNEFVPCYLTAKETASAVLVDGEIQPAEAFQCFENIRLRVKDQKSVPGWSLHQHQQEEEPFPTEKHEL